MEMFTIKATPFPKDQLPRMLEAHNIQINRYAEVFFAHPAFSTEHTNEMTIAIASLAELGLADGATLPEIFRQTEALGFNLCPANAGVFLRLAWTDQPESRNSILSGTHQAPDRAVTVLSEPLEQDDDFPKGLYLRKVDGNLWLRGYICDSTYRFSGDDLFAFEKPMV